MPQNGDKYDELFEWVSYSVQFPEANGRRTLESLDILVIVEKHLSNLIIQCKRGFGAYDEVDNRKEGENNERSNKTVAEKVCLYYSCF